MNAVDVLKYGHRTVLKSIEGLPDEVLMDPARHFPWWDGQAIRAGDFFAHFHEAHEPDMRAWLARVEQQSTPSFPSLRQTL